MTAAQWKQRGEDLWNHAALTWDRTYAMILINHAKTCFENANDEPMIRRCELALSPTLPKGDH